MTRREFELPDVGEGVAEGTLEAWLVDVDDHVTEDQPLAEVETDKALVEVPSPVNGTIVELHAEAGEVVPVGDVIVTFELDEGESGAGTTAETDPEPDPDPDPDTGEPTDDGATAGGATADPAETPATGNGTAEAASTGRVFAAPSTRRLARELGVDLNQVEGTGPGGRVTEADVQRAAGDGAPAEPAAGSDPEPESEPESAPATHGQETAGQETAGQEATQGTEDVIEAPPAVESADRERTLAAPATRRVAREEGVDIDAVPAVEQREGEGFVTAEAVREYAEKQRRAQEADASALATRSEGGVEAVDDPERSTATGEPRRVESTQREEREPYRGVRRTIGQQMERSKYTAPHVTHHDEVDVTELVETRERLKTVAEDRGVHLTYMPFVMKACVAALKEFPYVNAQLDEENEEIVKNRYYNLGVATATDAGLMVPVVDDVDQKGLLEIARETNDLVERTRERTVSRDELQGGTFTITNVGGIGGEYATPIVNYPEVAILALGAIEKKPRVVGEGENERIEPRHVLPLSLSFDHRVVDGAVGARFTNAVKRYLADPDLLMLE